MAQLVLRPGRHERLRAGHPWLYRSEVGDVRGEWAPGDVLDVRDAGGQLVGRGTYNPRTTLACRLFTRGAEAIDAGWLGTRLEVALDYRRRSGLLADVYRLCWSEGDGLP